MQQITATAESGAQMTRNWTVADPATGQSVFQGSLDPGQKTDPLPFQADDFGDAQASYQAEGGDPTLVQIIRDGDNFLMTFAQG